jgi:hypothetical protein
MHSALLLLGVLTPLLLVSTAISLDLITEGEELCLQCTWKEFTFHLDRTTVRRDIRSLTPLQVKRAVRLLSAPFTKDEMDRVPEYTEDELLMRTIQYMGISNTNRFKLKDVLDISWIVKLVNEETCYDFLTMKHFYSTRREQVERFLPPSLTDIVDGYLHTDESEESEDLETPTVVAKDYSVMPYLYLMAVIGLIVTLILR